ncbi:MAG: MarR family winged helix-turn-helix transcriptional regulator [Stackebrandtia sp.]
MSEPRWLTDREQCMWRTYRDMYQRLESALGRDLTAESGLSNADYALLVPLSETPGLGLRPRELRRAVGWDRSRLAHQLRRMESRGLVEREECPADARGTVIRLTNAGRDAIEAAAPGHAASVRSYFVDLLTDDEIDTLRGVAEKVLARLPWDPDARPTS